MSHTTTDTCSDRHYLDFYETPAWMVLATLKYAPISGTVGECCVGHGAIARYLPYLKSVTLAWTNDIDPDKPADFHFDACLPWQETPVTDWIVTNPPYADKASPIVINAYDRAKKGIVMLLRQTWDEVCGDRAEWLKEHPPTQKISLPRYCWRRGKNGNWSTDSVPVWIFIWQKGATPKPTIYLTEEDLPLYCRTPDDRPSEEEVHQAFESLVPVSGDLEFVPFDRLRLDGGTQCRQKLDLSHIDRLLEEIEKHEILDPIEVVFDGTDYWLVDGFHRCNAYCKNKAEGAIARVTRGTLDDALDMAAAANKDQKTTLGRSNEDKRNAVRLVLERHEDWSNRAIAEHVGVTHGLVQSVRNKMVDRGEISEVEARVGRDGKRQKAERGSGRKTADVIEITAIAQRQHEQIVALREENDALKKEVAQLRYELSLKQLRG